MERINTSITLLIVVIFAISMLIIAGFSIAQSTPKPTIPQFSIQVVDHSYDVPTTTTTSTDYDGRILTSTTPGYHMKNGSITISIKNQPFTPYYNSEGYPIHLYYRIRIRGFGEWWYPEENPHSYFQATNSTYTTLVYHYLGNFFQVSWGKDISYRADGRGWTKNFS